MNDDGDKQMQGADDRRGDALTRLLRAGDPAADDRLDGVERARMRQTITESASRSASGARWHRKWPGWMRPALTAAALTAAVGLFLWSAVDRDNAATPTEVAVRPTPPAPSNPATRTADASADAPVEPPGADTRDAAAQTTDTPPGTPSTIDAVARPAAVSAAPVVAAADAPSPDRGPRTVRFTAPRGTRIIWTLDPNFESPIAGTEFRQE